MPPARRTARQSSPNRKETRCLPMLFASKPSFIGLRLLFATDVLFPDRSIRALMGNGGKTWPTHLPAAVLALGLLVVGSITFRDFLFGNALLLYKDIGSDSL